MLRPPPAGPGEALDGLPRGARCRLIVSSALARYALVPFSADVIGREANEALAAHVFRRTHGERVDGWRIRVAPARAGHLRLACALDAALLDALAAAALERGVTLRAIEPALVAASNAARRRLPASCWLAVVEPGYLVLGRLIAGQWRHLAAERCGTEPGASIARALAREALLAEDAGAAANVPCWVVRFDPARPGPASAEPFLPQERAAA
jgi:hypothetical protein